MKNLAIFALTAYAIALHLYATSLSIRIDILERSVLKQNKQIGELASSSILHSECIRTLANAVGGGVTR